MTLLLCLLPLAAAGVFWVWIDCALGGAHRYIRDVNEPPCGGFHDEGMGRR